MRARGVLAGLLTLVFVALLGCSSPDDPAGSAGETVTVEHQYGSTTIPSDPTKVVTFGGAWSDSLIRLGVPITAEFLAQGYSGPNNRFAWTPEHSSTIVTYDVEAGTPDVAAIARFAPQVILAGYLPDRAAYDRLTRIAPTIPVMATDTVTDSWQDVMTTAGRIFGKQQQADEAVAEVEQQIAATKAKYPASQGKTFTFGQLTPQNQFGVVTSDTDPSAKLLAELGLVLDPAVKGLAPGGARTIVSAERIDIFASDLLIFWPLVGGPEAFDAIPGWDSLPAVRRGTTVFLTNDTASAFGGPTIYSVPWAIDKLTPALAKL
ncbi:ABC transporter substrate-binding protein [Gordonia sp. i37]|uniref:ABC transporter substrate-binding protein n=1 Tax=Gordonia sp. i37 TaxID=1961707 RepID=UPI0009ACF2A7|nr:ABC transporter substrate-binding protein [Gordonia sp. i37]OPX16311.1 ABC transporter substrate-binding protein [Gordonia sp. i37]